MASRRRPVDRDSKDVSIKRRCELLGLPRSSHCAKPKGKSPEGFTEGEERAMRTMDEARTEDSQHGARSHMHDLERHGTFLGRRHVGGPMRCMGIRSAAPRPSASKPARRHPEMPCLLRGKPTRLPDQARSTGVTHIPLGHGHACLSAAMDWHGRLIAGRRLRDTPGAEEAVMCVERAFGDHGTPPVPNGDQGSTHAAGEFMACPGGASVRQGMDGARRWADSVFTGRWFRDLRHGCVYQTEHGDMRGLRHVVAGHIGRHDYGRLHSSLDWETPAEWCFGGLNEVSAPRGG